ncbi:hypothetical protein AKO1_001315 [Acrasis kona]|uniref:Uncharacterized protein n=1 Tax=Acrasis kona TaxID=1008807 RepID=A0AAW2ZCE7_9EUKA
MQFNITRPQSSKSVRSASPKPSWQQATPSSTNPIQSTTTPKRPMSAPTHKRVGSSRPIQRLGSAAPVRPSSSSTNRARNVMSPDVVRGDVVDSFLQDVDEDDIPEDTMEDELSYDDEYDLEEMSPKQDEEFHIDSSSHSNEAFELKNNDVGAAVKKPKPTFKPTDIIWHINVRVPIVYELSATVDDSWLMSFELLGCVKSQFESFQLFSSGPLVFDAEQDIYICCSENSLLSYFNKERVFKIVLTPKYVREDERVAAMDMRNVFKSTPYVADQDIPVEKIKSEDVDNTKFMEEDSDEEEDGDDDDDKDENKEKEVSHARMKVNISVVKIGTVHELQKKNDVLSSLHEHWLPELDIKVLKSNPFPSSNNATNSNAYVSFDTRSNAATPAFVFS